MISVVCGLYVFDLDQHVSWTDTLILIFPVVYSSSEAPRFKSRNSRPVSVNI